MTQSIRRCLKGIRAYLLLDGRAPPRTSSPRTVSLPRCCRRAPPGSCARCGQMGVMVRLSDGGRGQRGVRWGAPVVPVTVVVASTRCLRNPRSNRPTHASKSTGARKHHMLRGHDAHARAGRTPNPIGRSVRHVVGAAVDRQPMTPTIGNAGYRGQSAHPTPRFYQPVSFTPSTTIDRTSRGAMWSRLVLPVCLLVVASVEAFMPAAPLAAR